MQPNPNAWVEVRHSTPPHPAKLLFLLNQFFTILFEINGSHLTYSWKLGLWSMPDQTKNWLWHKRSPTCHQLYSYVTKSYSDSVPCCKHKNVGGILYALIVKQNTESYGCRSNCVYKKMGETGDVKYCFKAGSMEVVCGRSHYWQIWV